MKRPPSTPSLLLVEDVDHKSVVAGIVSRHDIDLNQKPDGSRAVWIEAKGSAAQVLDGEVLEVELRAADLRSIGIIVDADDNFEARWDSIKNFCRNKFLDVPNDIPENGLIVKRDDGLKFGAWVMPNNTSNGMVETFCKMLAQPESSLWRYAVECTVQSKKHGADWKDVHEDRAHLCAWLAWRDTPGNQMGAAILRGILAHNEGYVPTFVSWFRELYQL